MRGSPAAAWLLGGWLLMSPPLIKDAKSTGGYRVDPSAKVADWTQVSAHDSATDCERAKASKALDAISLAERLGRKEGLEELVAAASHSVCVPAEYIYPPPAEDEGGECSAAPATL
jgi:hypothetical protein